MAAKEAQEESGISTLELVSKDIFDIDIHKIPTRGDVPAHLHYDARFLFRTTDNEKYEVSNESIDLAWVNIDEIDEYSSEESILRMVKKPKTFSRAYRQVFAHSLISHRKSSSSVLSHL